MERDVNGVSTFVFTAEHLAAICLQVGRAKDHDRVSTLSADQIESARDSLASAETAVAIAVASAAKENRNAELAAINRAEEQQFCMHAILHPGKELPE